MHAFCLSFTVYDEIKGSLCNFVCFPNAEMHFSGHRKIFLVGSRQRPGTVQVKATVAMRKLVVALCQKDSAKSSGPVHSASVRRPRGIVARSLGTFQRDVRVQNPTRTVVPEPNTIPSSVSLVLKICSGIRIRVNTRSHAAVMIFPMCLSNTELQL